MKQIPSSTADMLPAAAAFVERLRALFDTGQDEAGIWESACVYFRVLLEDRAL